jgi:septal ring factor EnvC (AmiA/AmiB activator)
MKKYSLSLALASAFLLMGFSMPSCPGQQAMQQQVDAVASSSAELSRKYGAIDSRVKSLEGDMGQIKQLLTQMTSTIQAQKEALDKFDAAFKSMEAQLAANAAKKSAPAAKGAPAKKKGK